MTRRTGIAAALLALLALMYMLAFRWDALAFADLQARHDPRTGETRVIISSFPWLSPAWAGAGASLALLTVALVAQARCVGGRRHAAQACAAIAGCLLSGELMKWGLGVLAPLGSDRGSATFPSVHSAVAMALAIGLARLSPRRIGLVAALYPILMGVLVLLVGWHYPSDVVGGCLLGAAWALAVPHADASRISTGAAVAFLGATLSMCALLVGYGADFGRAGVALQEFGASSVAITLAAAGAAAATWRAGAAANTRLSSGAGARGRR